MIFVNDKAHPWHESLTVSELLNALADPYPYVVIRLNGKYVSEPDFKKTKIPDNARIYLIPMVAGG